MQILIQLIYVDFCRSERLKAQRIVGCALVHTHNSRNGTNETLGSNQQGLKELWIGSLELKTIKKSFASIHTNRSIVKSMNLDA